MHRLYAYADSSDLVAHEATLVRAFSEFTATWPVAEVLLTNKKAPLMDAQNFADWILGLRVNAPVLTRQNVEDLLSFLAQLSREVNLPFVLGTWRERTAGTTDLCFIDRHVPDGAVSLILEGTNAS